MSTLDLVASLVALTVGLLLVVRVLLLRPRRVDPPIAAEPPRRTVADLVRMRAEQVVAATGEERSVTRRDAVEPVAEAPKPRGATSPRTPAVSRPAVAPPGRVGAESAPAREVTSSGPASTEAPWRRVAWMAGADQRAPAAAGPTAVLESAGPAPFPPAPTGCATEQAVAERALLQAFGVDSRDGPAPAASFAHTGTMPDDGTGSGQPVRCRVRCRDGGAVAGAVITVRDDRSRAVAAATADLDGYGDLHAQRRAGYVLIVTAPGHQPSAVALTINDAPLDVEVLLIRSAGVSGTVRDEAGPVPDASVLLIQGGHLVDTAHCDGAGRYRLGDLAAGEYCLSATAPGCAPISVELQMPEGADMRHDVVLPPVADSDPVGAGAEDG
ncbi:MAG: carboxypeptidase regulatory-like domain-containing protein [Pseudonocardia sp.]